MVSFSVSAKAPPGLRRPAHSPTGSEDSDDDEGSESNREYIREFDSSESPSETDTFKSPKFIVIPPKPNEWNPQKHPLFDSGNKALQFDVDSNSVNSAADSVAYGLNLRPNDNSLSAVDPTLKKLREDLDRLPDVSDGFDDYQQVPVKGYGRALLAGYGWHEGMGIGRNAREDVEVVELRCCSGREGLGYTGLHHSVNLQNEVPNVVKRNI